MWFSPTVLDGCTDEALSMVFCFLSLSLSRRLWQRWWWWWWWTLSCSCTGPDSIRVWSGLTRSYSLSSTSWWRCGVSEDAERRIGLRSTIGWVRQERHGKVAWESIQTPCTGSPKYPQHTHGTTFLYRPTFNFLLQTQILERFKKNSKAYCYRT